MLVFGILGTSVLGHLVSFFVPGTGNIERRIGENHVGIEIGIDVAKKRVGWHKPYFELDFHPVDGEVYVGKSPLPQSYTSAFDNALEAYTRKHDGTTDPDSFTQLPLLIHLAEILEPRSFSGHHWMRNEDLLLDI